MASSAKAPEDSGTWKSCCNILCCPPCPQRIAEKIAFNPPNPPLYELDCIRGVTETYAFLLSPEADTSGLKFLLKQDARLMQTRNGNSVAVLFVKCSAEKRCTILYSHGNAVDLGTIHRFLTDLSIATNSDVVCYDYSGYGQSTGLPSERNMKADIQASWDYVLTFHEPRPQKIVLFGQSLGTAAVLDLAISDIHPAGVILQSPFTSALAVACPKRKKLSKCAESFKNLEKVENVKVPVLIIHGTEDEVFNISHAEEMYDHCPTAVEPLFIEGGGHNNLELRGQFIDRINRFIEDVISS